MASKYQGPQKPGYSFNDKGGSQKVNKPNPITEKQSVNPDPFNRPGSYNVPTPKVSTPKKSSGGGGSSKQNPVTGEAEYVLPSGQVVAANDSTRSGIIAGKSDKEIIASSISSGRPSTSRIRDGYGSNPAPPIISQRVYTRQDIDFPATFTGNLPSQGKITAQSYVDYKLNEGVGYVSDKISYLVPEGKTKDFLFTRDKSFSPTELVKFGVFAPGMTTTTELTSNLIKTGQIIPEGKTSLVANVKPIGDNKATFEIFSKTRILGKDYTGVAKGGLKQVTDKGAIGQGYGYTFSSGVKGGKDVIATKFIGASKDIGRANLFVNKELAATIDIGQASSSRTVSKQFANYNIRKGLQFPTSKPIDIIKNYKLDKSLKTTDMFSAVKPLNEEGTQLGLIGETGQLKFMNSPNVRGKIFFQKAGESSTSGINEIVFSPSSSNQLQLRGVVSNQIASNVNSLIQSSTTLAKITISKPFNFASISRSAVAGVAAFRPRQSAYAGTGQYELTTYNQIFSSRKKPFEDNKIGLGTTTIQQSGQYEINANKNILGLGNPQKLTPGQGSGSGQGNSLINVPIITPIQTSPQVPTNPSPFAFSTPIFPTTTRIPFAPISLPSFPEYTPGLRIQGSQKKQRIPSIVSAELGIFDFSASSLDITGITSRSIIKRRKKR